MNLTCVTFHPDLPKFKQTFMFYLQTWINNMSKTKEPTITDSKNDDFTSVTFHPDLPKFKMTTLDKDTVDLFTRESL